MSWVINSQEGPDEVPLCDFQIEILKSTDLGVDAQVFSKGLVPVFVIAFSEIKKFPPERVVNVTAYFAGVTPVGPMGPVNPVAPVGPTPPVNPVGPGGPVGPIGTLTLKQPQLPVLPHV